MITKNKIYLSLSLWFLISLALHSFLFLTLNFVILSADENPASQIIRGKSFMIKLEHKNPIMELPNKAHFQETHPPKNIDFKLPSKPSLQILSFANDTPFAFNNFKSTNTNGVGKFGDETGITSQEGSSIYDYLYRYIAANVYYPKIFRDKEIEGAVTVRMVFDKSGIYLHNLTTIQSNSGFLNVLVSRTLSKIFVKPLPFDLSFTKHQYFIVDITFRFQAEANDNKDYISSHAFISGRHLFFLVQNDSSAILGFRSNPNGMLMIGLNYEDAIDWLKTNFTDSGKLRKQFLKQQLEYYKNDPAWSN